MIFSKLVKKGRQVLQRPGKDYASKSLESSFMGQNAKHRQLSFYFNPTCPVACSF